MNKMTVIQLLNKIANGEEVPKKIKYNDKIYIAKGNAIDYFVDYCSDEDEWCFNHYVRYENLNDEVEIIEEKKVPEKLKVHGFGDKDKDGHYVTSAFPTNEELMNKINDIIDCLTYLKSKGE